MSMTKEQEEAIEMLEDIKNNTWTTKYIMSSDSAKAETVLSMLKQKDKEIEKKDKIIDLMAEFIKNSVSEKKLINEICIKGKCNNEECHEDDWKECIKQYFERKSEE